MSGLKEKFKNVRNIMVGMPEEFYAFVEYLGDYCNDRLVPGGIIVSCNLLLHDIGVGINAYSNEPIPDFLVENVHNISRQLALLPSFIDLIADKEFSQEFEEMFSTMLKVTPLKRVPVESLSIKDEEELPLSVRNAVRWWASSMQCASYHNLSKSDDMMRRVLLVYLRAKEGYSEEEVKIFMDKLASVIMEEFKKSASFEDILIDGSCELSTDYHPHHVLATATAESRIDDPTSFPWKTSMIVGATDILLNGEKVWDITKGGWQQPQPGDESPKL